MANPVVDLEVVFSANTTDIASAEQYVKTTATRIESKPITKKIDADEKDAIAGMVRVEKAAKALVSQKTVANIDVRIERGEKNIARVQQQLEELKALGAGGLDVDADVRKAERRLLTLSRELAGLTSARSQIDVGADIQDAVDGLGKVEGAAKRLVSQDVAVRVNANVSQAQERVGRLEAQLTQLQAMDPTTEVRAETYKAEAGLESARKALAKLEGARATMQVDVNEGGAKQKLSDVADYAADAGKQGGDEAGSNLVTGILGALASIPIVGAVVGIGQAAGQALVEAVQDGMQAELGRDRLQALTGISEADAVRLGRTSSEAYASGFGESIESNMDLTRLGLQFDIIDPAATTRDSKRVIEGLAGIADVLGEDVQPIAAATAALLRTGLAKSADEVFDLLATGAREGVNRSEDLLDTFTEYPALFQRLGLSGEEALGLISQGLEGGARNSDLAADALKEFQIRATDGSKLSAEGFAAVGLNAEEMTAKIAAGGAGAKEGLDQVLDGLRAIEDPVARNAAAVALFGTQAEDLGEALFKMDLSNAVEQLNGVTGSAQTMFATLADNDASRVEGAFRSIEVAADGLKGALASSFGGGLDQLATFVTENRGPVLQFLSDMVNGAIDFGQSVVESAADGTEAFGELVSGPGADVLTLLAQIMHFTGQDTTDIMKVVDEMGQFEEKTDLAAERIRGLSDNLEDGRGRFNEYFDPQIDIGLLSDKTLALASAIDAVGYSAETGKQLVDGYTVAQDGSVQAGAELESQIRNSITAMSDEIAAAGAAGESQEQLAGRYATATGALVNQLVQMGLTEEQARALIDTINQTPGQKSTKFDSNAPAEREQVRLLGNAIVTLPDGSVIVTANTEDAQRKIDNFVTALRNIPGRRDVVINQVVQTTGADRGAVAAAYQAQGGILEFMAAGGIRGGLTPMQSIAQVVPASTWRVVGDRSDVPESFIPIDGSARSMAILLETMRRMGVQPMGEGGMAAGAAVLAAPGPSGPLRIVGTLDLGGGLTATIRGEIADAFSVRDQNADRRAWP